MLEVTKATSRVVGGRLQVQIDLKGDLPGHPFRGNQWSGGVGGSEGFPSSSGKLEKHDPLELMRLYEKMFGDVDEKTYTKEEIEAANSKDISNQFAKARGKEIDPLTEREQQVLKMHFALTLYVDRGYKKLNQKLRKGNPLTQEEEETAKMLSSLERDMDVVMYRGIPGLEKMTKKLGVGQEIEMVGYSSTTLDTVTAMAFTKDLGVKEPAIMEIKVKRGSVLPSFFSSHETEVILPTNSKFRIVGFKRVEHPLSPSGFVKVVQLEQLT